MEKGGERTCWTGKITASDWLVFFITVIIIVNRQLKNMLIDRKSEEPSHENLEQTL